MPKFIVKNTTIMHNKKTYSIGKEIELTDDESKKLADYVTPVAKTVGASTESTVAPKPAKTSKKADKVASETTTPAVDEVTTDEKKEDINGSETIQTATN